MKTKKKKTEAAQLRDSLRLLVNMAKRLRVKYGEFDTPTRCPDEVEQAFKTVDSWIKDSFPASRTDRPLSPFMQARLHRVDLKRLALLEAAEKHGNAEGTETQLKDMTEFFDLAWEIMSDAERAKFVRHKDVRDFIDREG